MSGSLERALPFVAIGMVLGSGLVEPSRAAACGGLFCNSSRSLAVNQAAERIIFANNGDGTVTAVIEIMYEGRADEFAWLLPVSGVPEVAVSSGPVFDELQRLTAPTFTLMTRVDGTCGSSQFSSANAFGNPVGALNADASLGDAAPVTVEAAGTVGPYDYTVISVADGFDDPADVAIDWLVDNGYDVGDLGPEVLRPYLEEELNLLAFRLSKGNVTGSIRPVRLTYEAEAPSIPIRPTAVAANENMGVMVFMVGRGRAVPMNYKALELNEALVDWFDPQSSYGDVVNAAADEAGGRGFVTEFAGSTEFLQQAIFSTAQRAQWNAFQSDSYDDGLSMLRQAAQLYSSWDGFDVALRQGVTPDDPELIQTALFCAGCPEASEVEVDPGAFVEALYVNVIEPVAATHDLLTQQPTLTRLYTTMSPDEMTQDPFFDENRDLPDVDNQHLATQVIDCRGGGSMGSAPWRIELDNGDVVYGRGSASQWPIALDAQPANRRIKQYTTEGEGEVVEDNRAAITRSLRARRPSSGCSAAPGRPSGRFAVSWVGLIALVAGIRRRR